jgi:hypothetical protein
VTDVAVLTEIPTLEQLALPAHAANIRSLHKLPNLQRLGFKLAGEIQPGAPHIPETTAAEFWKEFDANPWIERLHNAGVRPKAIKRLEDGTWDVNLDQSIITDLAVLREAPISRLSLGDTTVADLNPLRGMPLKRLTIYRTKVTDLSPLNGLRLDSLNLSGTKVKDLSVLRNMPLSSLRLHDCTELTDLSPLTNCKELTRLTVPLNAKNIELLRASSKLERLSFTADPKIGYQPAQTPAEFWREYDLPWAKALRESGIAITALQKLPDGTWDVNLNRSGISDLAILKGAPISKLWLSYTPVSDLTPLRGMPLTRLTLVKTKVTDLNPLRNMRLEELILNDTRVTDLGPLQGMPLRMLHLSQTKVADLTAIRGMPLTSVRLFDCPGLTDLSPLAGATQLRFLTLPASAKNIEFLRQLPKLKRLSFREKNLSPAQTTAEFWQEYDAAREE